MEWKPGPLLPIATLCNSVILHFRTISTQLSVPTQRRGGQRLHSVLRRYYYIRLVGYSARSSDMTVGIGSRPSLSRSLYISRHCDYARSSWL